MNTNDELYKVGLALHGHKCPAMPLGLRAGLAAMEVLGVQHAPDGQLTAWSKLTVTTAPPVSPMGCRWPPAARLARATSAVWGMANSP
jgi:formylmethanofuran dehydrogenase subunit E